MNIPNPVEDRSQATVMSLNLDFGQSKIHFGKGLESLPSLMKDRRVVLFTDRHLYQLYYDQLKDYECLIVPESEEVKSLKNIEHFAIALLNRDVSREDVLVAFGGGAVCDFTGFLASVYKRGIGFVYVPTTVLAQVDAAIGGKTAVNLSEIKNILGVFSTPSLILINTYYCQTQTERQFVFGFSELIKHALIADYHLFVDLENNKDKLLDRDPATLHRIIHRGAQVKINIVLEDSQEKGLRKSLNFGHTIGHAIEKMQQLSHGEAISIGMCAAIELSIASGRLCRTKGERAIQLIRDFGLPTELTLTPEVFWPFLVKDKKSTGTAIDFVFLEDIGKARIERLSLDELYHQVQAIYALAT